MIRTESEYQRTLKRLGDGRRELETQRARLVEAGLEGAALEQAMQPLLAFRAQLKEEAEEYESAKRGELGTLESLGDVGRWLIGARIAQGWSQKELARRLGVSEAQVSRDERNEYRGVAVDRAQRILEVMGVSFQMQERLGFKPSVEMSVTQTTPDSSATIPPLTKVPNQVSAFLRANPKLSPKAAEKLAQMFQFAVEAAEREETT